MLHGEDYYYCIFFELSQTNKVKDQPVFKKFVQNIKSILEILWAVRKVIATLGSEKTKKSQCSCT